MKKAYIKNIYIKRWFDKINWNSYFNYYLINNKGERLDSESDFYYGYWSWLWTITGYLQREFEKRKIHLAKKCELIDLGYWLKREMINL